MCGCVFQVYVPSDWLVTEVEWGFRLIEKQATVYLHKYCLVVFKLIQVASIFDIPFLVLKTENIGGLIIFVYLSF